MDKNISQSLTLYIKMTGPKVGAAKLAVSDLAEVLNRSQQALKRIAQVFYGEESHGKGRKKKDIERQCELYLVGWQEGSAIAELELGPQPDQRHLYGLIGEESLKALSPKSNKKSPSLSTCADSPSICLNAPSEQWRSPLSKMKSRQSDG